MTWFRALEITIVESFCNEIESFADLLLSRKQTVDKEAWNTAPNIKVI
jgi:hypothetical protein